MSVRLDGRLDKRSATYTAIHTLLMPARWFQAVQHDSAIANAWFESYSGILPVT